MKQVFIDRAWDTIYQKIDNFLDGKEVDGSMGYIRRNFPAWQYNGADTFENVIGWCEERFGNDFWFEFDTIYFKHMRDKTMFLLVWQ